MEKNTLGWIEGCISYFNPYSYSILFYEASSTHSYTGEVKLKTFDNCTKMGECEVNGIRCSRYIVSEPISDSESIYSLELTIDLNLPTDLDAFYSVRSFNSYITHATNN